MRKHTGTKAKTIPTAKDLTRLDKMTDADIQKGINADPNAAPIQKDLGEFRRYRGPQKKAKKVPVSMRFDAEIVDHFRARGRGWQKEINDHLLHVVRTSNKIFEKADFESHQPATAKRGDSRRGSSITEKAKAPARRRPRGSTKRGRSIPKAAG